MSAGIDVYGTDWCGLTHGVRKYLMRSRLAYAYHNIEEDPRADEFVLATNHGTRRFPIVVVKETVMTNPTLGELQQLLDDYLK